MPGMSVGVRPGSYPTATVAAAVFLLTLSLGSATTVASAQEPASRERAGVLRNAEVARKSGIERAVESEWQLGVEIGAEPAALLRWQVHAGGWTLGAGATAGPGKGDVQLRIAPELRLERTLFPRLLVGAGLGLEWTRLAREGNDEESELQWDVSVGWRATERLLTEAGLRWTDYRNRRATGYLRIAVPLGTRDGGARPTPPRSTAPPPSSLAAAAAVHAALPRLGVPPDPARQGRLHLSVEPVERRGSGIVLVAANPRGDPDPRSGTDGANVDRLGLGSETWASGRAWDAWARWRSDLHTDPSIAQRTRAATEGRFFPVSVSFSGGAGWRPAPRRLFRVSARHDPQALLWLPHLGQERTARVGSAYAEGTFERASMHVTATRLEPIQGRSVEALDHTRIGVALAAAGALRVGVEHERLDTPFEAQRRSRAVVERPGRISARVAAGNDVAARVGIATKPGVWRASAWASFRSEPELMHHDRLVASGWSRPEPAAPSDPPAAEPSPAEGDVWGYGLTAARGPLEMVVTGGVGDPVWTPGAIEGGHGGSLDLTWTDRLWDDRIEGRLAWRVAAWGPDRAWWREHPAAEGWIESSTPLGPALVSARVAARTKLVSERAGIQHAGGAEVGVGLTGPFPDLGSLRGMTVSMRLDDVFDSGLPVRVGAPERGRRLTLSLAWMTTSGVDR